MQRRARAHTHKHTCYALSRATEEQIFYYRIRFSARQKVKETETIAAAGSVASNYMNISREKTEKRANPAGGCQQPQGRDEGDSKPWSLHHRLLLPRHRSREGFRRQVPCSQFSVPGSQFEVLSSRFPVVALCARTTLAGKFSFSGPRPFSF